MNQSTGAIEATGVFPNPGNILRPGQYGKVRVAVETLHGALLVPQQAVSEMQGSYQVATVDGNDAVSIQTDQRWRPDWVLLGGPRRVESG